MTVRLHRVAILKPCCIGDAVMALPAIDSVHLAPTSPLIELWTGAHTQPVFAQHPAIASTVQIPSVPTGRDLPRLIWQLRHADADGFIVLDASRLIDAACRVAGTEVLGSVRTPRVAHQHEIDKYLDAVVQAGFQQTVEQPKLELDPEAIQRALAKIDAVRGSYVALHPGGAVNPGTSMHSKRWPAEHWAELASWLDSEGIGIVLTGSPNERELCAEVGSASNAIVAAGRLTLVESAAVALASRAFVGPDTGLAHLAAAVGASVIAIFGPTNPRQYAPRGEDVEILAPPGAWDIQPRDLRHGESANRPSTSGISVSAVIEALQPRLSRAGASAC